MAVRSTLLARIGRILEASGGYMFVITTDVKVRRRLFKSLDGLPVAILPCAYNIKGTVLHDLDDFFTHPLTMPPVYLYNIDEAEQQPPH